MSFQLFVLTYLRFVLAGDLAGAWRTFGGLAAQLTHLGTLLSIAATENAMIAMAYDRSVRLTIETNSRKRISKDQMTKLISMLTEEHDQTKKTTLREVTAAATEKKANNETIKTVLKNNDPLRRKRGPRGKGQVGKFVNNNSWNNNQWVDNWQGDQNQGNGHRPQKQKGKGKKRKNSWQQNGWNSWTTTEWNGKGQQPSTETTPEVDPPAVPKATKVKKNV